jgi:hypothetical protein
METRRIDGDFIKKFKQTWLNETHYDFLLRKGNGKIGEGLETLINDYYVFQEKLKTSNDKEAGKKLWGSAPSLINPFNRGKDQEDDNDKSIPIITLINNKKKVKENKKIEWF